MAVDTSLEEKEKPQTKRTLNDSLLVDQIQNLVTDIRVGSLRERKVFVWYI